MGVVHFVTVIGDVLWIVLALALLGLLLWLIGIILSLAMGGIMAVILAITAAAAVLLGLLNLVWKSLLVVLEAVVEPFLWMLRRLFNPAVPAPRVEPATHPRDVERASTWRGHTTYVIKRGLRVAGAVYLLLIIGFAVWSCVEWMGGEWAAGRNGGGLKAKPSLIVAPPVSRRE